MRGFIKKTITIGHILLVSIATYGREHKENALRDSLTEFAKDYLGCKYKYASKGPSTFDCSGYTGYVFKHFGFTLNSSSSAQYEQGEKVKLSKVKKGDLIFFKGSNANNKSVGHVGIVYEIKEDSDTLLFIHASVQSGVTIDAYPGLDYYNKRFIGCKRIIGEIEIETPELEESTDSTSTKKKEEKLTNDTIQSKDSLDTPQETIHIVESGDNLYRLSKKYGCTITNIQEWNHLKGTNLRIGQKLYIHPANKNEE